MSPFDVFGFALIDWAIEQFSDNPANIIVWTLVVFILGCMFGVSIPAIAKGFLRRNTVSKLNERDVECLSNLLDVKDAGKRFSVNEISPFLTSLQTLEKLGITIGFDPYPLNGNMAIPFVSNPDWRRWLKRHRDEFRTSAVPS